VADAREGAMAWGAACAAAAIAGMIASGARTDRLAIAVYVYAGIPGPELAQAKQRVLEEFRRISVEIIWRSRAPGPNDEQARRELTLIVLPRPMKGRSGPKGELGLAVGGSDGRIAYVFYDRVRDAANAYALSMSAVLALGMAHEIGHLLLPYGGHATSGIMQASWNRDNLRPLARGDMPAFAPEQVDLILEALRIERASAALSDGPSTER
jgi:hypothetical protein